MHIGRGEFQFRIFVHESAVELHARYPASRPALKKAETNFKKCQISASEI